MPSIYVELYFRDTRSSRWMKLASQLRDSGTATIAFLDQMEKVLSQVTLDTLLHHNICTQAKHVDDLTPEILAQLRASVGRATPVTGDHSWLFDMFMRAFCTDRTCTDAFACANTSASEKRLGFEQKQVFNMQKVYGPLPEANS